MIQIKGACSPRGALITSKTLIPTSCFAMGPWLDDPRSIPQTTRSLFALHHRLHCNGVLAVAEGFRGSGLTTRGTKGGDVHSTESWKTKRQQFMTHSLRPSQVPAERQPLGLTVVCVSDTHGLHRKIDVPDGDVLIHAGNEREMSHTQPRMVCCSGTRLLLDLLSQATSHISGKSSRPTTLTSGWEHCRTP